MNKVYHISLKNQVFLANLWKIFNLFCYSGISTGIQALLESLINRRGEWRKVFPRVQKIGIKHNKQE